MEEEILLSPSSSSPLLQQDSGQALPPPGKPSTPSSTCAASTTSKGAETFSRAQIHRPWGLEGPQQPKTYHRARVGESQEAQAERRNKVKRPGARRGEGFTGPHTVQHDCPGHPPPTAIITISMMSARPHCRVLTTYQALGQVFCRHPPFNPILSSLLITPNSRYYY